MQTWGENICDGDGANGSAPNVAECPAGGGYGEVMRAGGVSRDVLQVGWGGCETIADGPTIILPEIEFGSRSASAT